MRIKAYNNNVHVEVDTSPLLAGGAIKVPMFPAGILTGDVLQGPEDILGKKIAFPAHSVINIRTQPKRSALLKKDDILCLLEDES